MSVSEAIGATAPVSSAASAGPSPVAAARAALGKAHGQSLWALTDEQLAGEVAQALAVRAQADAVLMTRLGEAHTRELSKRRGFRSLPAWLRATHRVAPGEAASLCRLAVGLTERIQATGAALAAGSIGTAQAQVIDRAVEDLAKDLPEAALVAGEELLLAEAGRCDPGGLAGVGQRLHQVLDPAGYQQAQDDKLETAERSAHAERGLTMSADRFGAGSLWRGSGWTGGDAVIGAALDPLSAPRPADATGPDSRSAAARRYDALVELCRRALHATTDTSGDGGKVQLRVTVPLEVLEGRLRGTGTILDTGRPISAGLARRLACDAQVIPIVLGSKSEPLDVGRSMRLFTGARRTAIEERDRGCVQPGCPRTPASCDIHHLHPWAQGGQTSVEGGCLGCTEHHPLFDSGHWQPVLINGRIWVRPPPSIDPSRIPRLNHHHRAGPLRR